jgi:hypothetical protein
MPSNYFLGSPNQVQDTFESAMDTPLTDSEYSRLSFESGYKGALSGVTAGLMTDGDRVSYEDAKKEATLAGVPNLDFQQYGDGSVGRDRLNYSIQRQKDLIEINTQLNRGAGSTSGYMKGVGSWLGAIASDPLEVLAMGIPVGRVAGTAVKGATITERLTARGVMGFKEGAVSAAVVEPLYAYGADASGDDYDIYDSFTNIAFSGAAGGVLGSAGGFIADSFKARALGGVPQGLSRTDEVNILNTAAAQLDTTGRLDVSDLMNSTYLKNTGHTFDEIISNPMLRNMMNEPGGAIKLNKLADETIQSRIFTDDPEFAVKYNDLLNEIETLNADINKSLQPIDVVPTKYDRALVESRTNPALKQEAQDYGRYKQLMIDTSSTKDQRIIKKLIREADELNVKHDGKMKAEYDKSVNQSSAQRRDIEIKQERMSALETELDTVNSDLQQRKLLKRIEMENDASIKKNKARETMLASSNQSLERLNRDVSDIGNSVKGVKDVETLDDMSRNMDEILTSYKDEYARYIERTGVELQVEEIDIDVNSIKTATREIAECMVKNGI